MDTISERIKSARKARKVSQKALAVMCGWPEVHTRISNYETGVSEPETFDDIELLAAALDVSPGWLAFGEDSGERLSGKEKMLLKLYREAPDVSRELALHTLAFKKRITDPEKLSQEELDKAMPREKAMKVAGLSSGNEKRAKKFDPIAEKAQSLRRTTKSKRSTRKSGDPQQVDLLDKPEQEKS